MPRTVLQQIAGSFDAMQNCAKSGNEEWHERHRETIEQLCDERLPCGSGFDSGTQFDYQGSRNDRLVFWTSYHHMSEHGYYTGWTEHSVVVKPSLHLGFDLRVTGRNTRDDIKDYIAETFSYALDAPVDPPQPQREPIDCQCEQCELVKMVRSFLDHTAGWRDLKDAYSEIVTW